MFECLKRSSKMIEIAARNYAPRILNIAGTGLIIGGTVWACKRTLECEPIIQDCQDELAEIREFQVEEEKEGIVDNHTAEKAWVYAKTGVEIAKKAAGPVLVETAGIVLKDKGFAMQSERLVGAVALAEAYSMKLMEYRANVISDAGADKDTEYYYGLTPKTVTKITTDPETGEVTKEKEKVFEGSPDGGPWGFFFDESSELYSDSPMYNKLQIKSIMNEIVRDYHEYNCITMNDIIKKFRFNADTRDRLLKQAGHEWGFMYFRNGENPYGFNHIASNMFQGSGKIDPKNARFEEGAEPVAYIEFYPYYIANKNPFITKSEFKEVSFIK